MNENCKIYIYFFVRYMTEDINRYLVYKKYGCNNVKLLQEHRILSNNNNKKNKINKCR